MIRLMVAAPASGSGKTMLSSALLYALKERGHRPCAFKCGPDYVDPQFHRSVEGVPSRNLDLFFYDEETLRRIYAEACTGYDAAVTEGVMGFYDGLSGQGTTASSWHVADTLSMPVLLVVSAKETPMALASRIKGMLAFREESHIRGALLNRCTQKQFDLLRDVIETETRLPVFGFLPEMPEAVLENRHLGLVGTEELANWDARLKRVSDALCEHTDMDALCKCFETETLSAPDPEATGPCDKPVRIAVAKDEATSFYYAENDAVFLRAGAEVVPFSLTDDAALPDGVSALYLPGGYPELHAARLAENTAMKTAVRDAVRAGMPLVAEGGGFLYLLSALKDADGKKHEMAHVLDGEAESAGHLVRFGYAYLTAKEDSLLFRKGERVPVHEFHYWDTPAHGDAFFMEKPDGIRKWETGVATETMYAAFPQLCLAALPDAVKRFTDAARRYGDRT